VLPARRYQHDMSFGTGIRACAVTVGSFRFLKTSFGCRALRPDRPGDVSASCFQFLYMTDGGSNGPNPEPNTPRPIRNPGEPPLRTPHHCYVASSAVHLVLAFLNQFDRGFRHWVGKSNPRPNPSTTSSEVAFTLTPVAGSTGPSLPHIGHR